MAKKRKRSILEVLGLLTLVGGAVGYAIYKLTTKVYVEKTRLQNLKPEWDALTGTVTLSIQNKSNTAIPLQGFVGEILYNGISMADLRIGAIVIEPKKVTDIPVSFRAPWTELPTSIEQIFRERKWYPQFSVKGNVFAANFNLPINQQLWIV